ncbi:MAG: hypothetical protein OXM87_12225 [Truepera sp.]|nr:hypothetical protein [Truepera sp.]
MLGPIPVVNWFIRFNPDRQGQGLLELAPGPLQIVDLDQGRVDIGRCS